MKAASANGDGFAGYWADTPYVESIHSEQEPWRIAMAVRSVGGAHPDLDAPFVYCDVGCGRGYTILAMAAASPHGEFHGVDVNPAHIDEARRMAKAAGLANARFHLSAVEALPPGAVPQCDFIAAHGVFSWVDPTVAESVLAFMRRALKPEGLAFASVNLDAGWSQMLPVRRHLREAFADATGAPRERLRAATASAWAVFGPGTRFAKLNPVAAEIIGGWPNAALDYIPHELMNATWRLFTMREILALFAGADFACAGALSRHDTDVREEYAALIHGDDEARIEDRLSKARGERFRALVFRPKAAATPAKSMILPQDELFGVAAPQNVRELYSSDLVDSLGPAELDLIVNSATGAGVTLGEVVASSGPGAKLKLFASINQLARRGALVTYRQRPAPSTRPGRIAVRHPLTTALLRSRYAMAIAASAPSPVFGGAVQIPGSIAAVLRAHLDGAADLAKAGEALYDDAIADDDFWAVADPANPRDALDFAEVKRRYLELWLPYLERMRVVAPV